MQQIPDVTEKESKIIIYRIQAKYFKFFKASLTKTINKHMKFCKLRVTFQSNNRLKNYFHFKDFVPETLQSSLIYKLLCRSCTAFCIGMT